MEQIKGMVATARGTKWRRLSRKAILSEIDKSLKRSHPRTHVRCCIRIMGRHGGYEWFSSPKGLKS